MRLTEKSLKSLLNTHVVELKFNRRHNKPGWSNSRRSLGTTNWDFLNSLPSITAFNFVAPSNPPPYNASAKKLVILYDLFMQGWRMVDINSCEVVAAMSLNATDEFWKYYSKVLYKMSRGQKKGFMDA